MSFVMWGSYKLISTFVCNYCEFGNIHIRYPQNMESYAGTKFNYSIGGLLFPPLATRLLLIRLYCRHLLDFDAGRIGHCSN